VRSLIGKIYQNFQILNKPIEEKKNEKLWAVYLQQLVDRPGKKG